MAVVISRETGKLLSNRRFLLLWANQMLTQTALHLTTFSMIIWVFELMKANIAVSLWLFASLIPSATLGVLAGVIVDNYDRKRIMVVTNLLWALVVLTFIFAKDSFVAILVITTVAQGIDEFFGPSQVATLPRLVEKSELLAANSLFSMSMYAASVVGFVLAGPLLRFFGFAAPFLLAAVFSLLGAVFIMRLPSVEVRRPKVKLRGAFVSHFKRELKEGIVFCLERPLICSAGLFMVLLLVGGVAAGTLAPGFMEQGLGIDAKDVSLVGGIPVSLGLALGAVLLKKIGRKGWRNKKLVGRGLLMLGVAALALAGVPLFRPYLVNYANHITDNLDLPQAFERLPGISIVAGALIFVLGVAATFVVVPTATFLQKVTPDRMRGRVFGFLNTATAILQGLMTLIFGAAADLFSPPPLVAVVGVLALMAAIFRDKLFNWVLACMGSVCSTSSK